MFLAARPLPLENLDAFIRRFTDDARTKKEILAQNTGLKLFHREVFVRVPYRLLSDSYKKIAMTSSAWTRPVKRTMTAEYSASPRRSR